MSKGINSVHRRIHIEAKMREDKLRRKLQAEENKNINNVEMSRRMFRTRSMDQVEREMIDDAIQKRRRRKNG